MARRIIIRNGKKYIVNVPDYADSEVDQAAYQAGFLDSAGSGSLPSRSSIYPPIIGLQPRSITTGSTATIFFISTAGPIGPFDYIMYRWQKGGVALLDGGAITGSITTTLTLTNIAAGNAGNYTMTATNQYGNVTSSIAVLTVV